MSLFRTVAAFLSGLIVAAAALGFVVQQSLGDTAGFTARMDDALATPAVQEELNSAIRTEVTRAGDRLAQSVGPLGDLARSGAQAAADQLGAAVQSDRFRAAWSQWCALLYTGLAEVAQGAPSSTVAVSGSNVTRRRRSPHHTAGRRHAVRRGHRAAGNPRTEHVGHPGHRNPPGAGASGGGDHRDLSVGPARRCPSPPARRRPPTGKAATLGGLVTAVVCRVCGPDRVRDAESTGRSVGRLPRDRGRGRRRPDAAVGTAADHARAGTCGAGRAHTGRRCPSPTWPPRPLSSAPVLSRA